MHMQQQFTVANIKCSACAKMISLVLRKLAGVQQVSVDEASGLVQVTAQDIIPAELISAKLAEKGYQVKQD